MMSPDDVTSPCIDAGYPNSPVGPEPMPNRSRINIGAYGSTPEASKSPSLDLHNKYGGGSGTPENPYQIATAADLIALGETPEDYDKHFKLMADIDLSEYRYDRAVIAPDTNDVEGGSQGTPFTGVFDGYGYVISNLNIQGSGYLGLFGTLESEATILNLGLELVDVNGIDYNVGGLVGSNYGSITASYSTGAVSRDWSVGGLVGNDYAEGFIHQSIGGNTTTSFWDIQTSGQAESAGGKGKTTAEMQTARTFLEAGWDFVDETANGTEDIWRIIEGQDYPRLWWEASN